MPSKTMRSEDDRPRRAYLQHTVTAKVSRDEQSELEQVAKACGRSVSSWAREVLLRYAREPIADPIFTEIIALRMLSNSILRRISCGELISPETFNGEMQMIRTTKHQTAREVMQQYAISEVAR